MQRFRTFKGNRNVVFRCIRHHHLLFGIAFGGQFAFVYTFPQTLIQHCIKRITVVVYHITGHFMENPVKIRTLRHAAFHCHSLLVFYLRLRIVNDLTLNILAVIYGVIICTTAAFPEGTGCRDEMETFHRSSRPKFMEHINNSRSDFSPVIIYRSNLRIEIRRLLHIVKAGNNKVLRYTVTQFRCSGTQTCSNIIICTDNGIRKRYCLINQAVHILHTAGILIIAKPGVLLNQSVF